MTIGSLDELIACAGLLAGERAGFTTKERKLFESVRLLAVRSVDDLREQIRAGLDPLGETFCRLRPARERRASGATYTPPPIVESMIGWAASQRTPDRVVDPGTGSGRFLLSAADRFPRASLVAVDSDPLAMLMLRANAAVHGIGDRITFRLTEFENLELPTIEGPTLFIGNPPYVRHHELSEEAKEAFARSAARRGLRASKLAGLHVHFFMKTLELARTGDFGAFITAGEWLDVNYGSLLRTLLSNGLGGTAVHILSPRLQPFSDATVTGAITCFDVGSEPRGIRFRWITRLGQLTELRGGREVPRSVLERTDKWSVLGKDRTRSVSGEIELGELFRVHRGQVTGANQVFVAGHYPGQLPRRVLFPAVTRARELFAAGEALTSTKSLRCVIDLPVDLNELTVDDRGVVEQFLEWAQRQGAHESYIARHRRAWWAVGLKDAAPILCTYMARRPPVFVRNLCRARHVNIAHGLYPRQPLPEPVLLAVARHLTEHASERGGRTYAGGLTKFEPRELERLRLPRLEDLHASTEDLDTRGAGARRRDRERGIPASTP